MALLGQGAGIWPVVLIHSPTTTTHQALAKPCTPRSPGVTWCHLVSLAIHARSSGWQALNKPVGNRGCYLGTRLLLSCIFLKDQIFL